MQSQTAGSSNNINSPAIDAVETRSGVSWAAIIAGAAAAAALSLVLFLLGTGLGLSAISPWEQDSPTAIGISTILWITFTQLAASAVGGYLAGRLRTKWTSLHTDEVYFRDTAHGLLAWAVATLLMAVLTTGAIRSAMNTAASAGAGIAKTTALAGAGAAGATTDGASSGGNPLDYFSDMMFRGDKMAAGATSGEAPRAEVLRILANGVQSGNLAADDRAYLAQTVAARTGMAPADAERRVDEVYTKARTTATNVKNKAKEAADTARKAAAGAALWMVVALLLGAFVASLAATFGGKLRDAMPVTRSPLKR